MPVVNIDDKNSEDEVWYILCTCLGCKTPQFVVRTFFLDSNDEKSFFDEQFPQEYKMFPFLEPEIQLQLPKELRDRYYEVEKAFDSNSPILAGVGLRILVEVICILQKIIGANLKIRILKLNEIGLISKNELPILDKLREIGNSSAHDIKYFSLEKLSYALEIINHILISIYILPKINKKLILPN